MNVFTNLTLKISITLLNGITFGWLQGFGMMIDSNTSYYALDWSGNTVFLLNENYDYVTKNTFPLAAYILTVNSNIFLTGQNNIWKTDKYLNVLITYSESGVYKDIFFNCTENLIYVAALGYTYFQVFDGNLTLVNTVSIAPSNPRSFCEYNNELYVGTLQGLVYVIANKAYIRTFTGCSSASVSSIVSDSFGYIMTSCESTSVINLYYYNGTFTGNSLNTPSLAYYVGYDSKGRFVLLTQFQLSIYY